MAVQNDLLPTITAILQSPWFTIVLLPLGYAMGRLIQHAITRKMEGKPESEKLDQYHQLADLHEKLKKAGASMADLDALRAHAFGEVADNAITVAQTYTTFAQRLVSDYEAARDNDVGLLNGADGELTQAEMNLLSSRKAAQADDELATVIATKIRGMDQQTGQVLLQSQAAWDSFRQKEALRESLRWEGGSISPLMANSRYEAITRERIAMLFSEEVGENGQTDIVVVAPKTPRNLFDIVELSVPFEKVRESLGTPSYQHGRSCQYRYEETQVEISFDDNNAVKEMVVALIHGQVYEGASPAYAVDVPLGALTLHDVLAIDESLVVEHFFSARTEEVSVRGRMGPSGAWTPFRFGALKVFSGAGRLQHTEFEWDYESQKLLTDPKKVLINWMAFGSEESTGFSWFIR